MMDQENSKQFISSLVAFLQNICCGFVSFEDHVLLTGNMLITVDSRATVECILNENIYKTDNNAINFVSSSFRTVLEKQDIRNDACLLSTNVPKSEPSVCKTDNMDTCNNGIQKDINENMDTETNIGSCDLAFGENVVHQDDTKHSKTHTKKRNMTKNGVKKFDTLSIISKSSSSELGTDIGIPSTDSSTLTTAIKEEIEACNTESPPLEKKKYKQKYKYRPHNQKCSLCSFTCPGPYKLRQHMVKHTGEKPFVCETCGKGFSSKKWLKQHNLSHTGGTTFLCDICKKPHINQHLLNKHMANHLKEERYKCDHCDYKDYQWTRLKRHVEQNHTDGPAQTYSCEICSKVYTIKGSLYAHMLTHKEKPFECDVCQMKFTKKSLLETHKRRVHMGERPYSCDQCDKSFFTRPELQKHKVIHSGERPHVCDVCGQGFASANTLASHILRHTGERPFECKNCHKRFTQGGARNVHQRSCIARSLTR